MVTLREGRVTLISHLYIQASYPSSFTPFWRANIICGISVRSKELEALAEAIRTENCRKFAFESQQRCVTIQVARFISLINARIVVKAVLSIPYPLMLTVIQKD